MNGKRHDKEKIKAIKIPTPPKLGIGKACIFLGLGTSNIFFALEILMTSGMDTKANKNERREIKTIRSILIMGWFRLDD